MPYASTAQAKTAGFPTKMDGTSLSLQQVNNLARIYDAVKTEKVDSPMAVAISAFKKKYSLVNGRWTAKSEEQDMDEMTVKATADMMQRHGPGMAHAIATVRAYKKGKKKSEMASEDAVAVLRHYYAAQDEDFAYPTGDQKSGHVSDDDADDREIDDPPKKKKKRAMKAEDDGPFAYPTGDQESGHVSADDAYDGEIDDKAVTKKKRRPSYEELSAKIRKVTESHGNVMAAPSLDSGSFQGSIEYRRNQVAQAVREQTALSKSDLIATYQDEAVVFDWENRQYWSVNYQMDENGVVSVGSIKKMRAQLVVSEQREQLRSFFREHLRTAAPYKAAGIKQIAIDLMDERHFGHLGRAGGGSLPRTAGTSRLLPAEGGRILHGHVRGGMARS